MKGTSIFQFKSWPKIHQPLPRTPRESQQLLNALTSSFRRQLDQAYPASKPPNNEGDRQPLNTDSSLHATDQHLHNILDNPLFRIVPPKAKSLGGHHAGKNVDQEKRLAEDPMGVFDEMAASGAVTTALITKCLKSQLLLVRSTDNMELSEAMKTSRTASRVVDWFWASDGASRQMLLRWRSTASSLAKFMVAEGLQDTIIRWLEMLMSYDLGGRNGRMNEVVAQQTFNNFLVGFIEAEIRYGKGLASAFQNYLHVCNMHSICQTTNLPQKTMLLAAGACLNRAALELKPLNELVSVKTYDEYQRVISILSVPNSLLSASISLCHPKNPDPLPLIQFVETLSPDKFLTWNAARRDAIFRISCDALHVLIDQKNIRDAIHLARLIQQFFPSTTTNSTAEGSRFRYSSKEEDDLLSRLELSLT
ncbi:hypothetical protein N7456_009966 [Penicillium angulare]|uniref:Uncharacterized protein n=1 Tax=Penicillium angulare TaxID=116970 RepID=A0A9W9F5V7_9EURO|nr:hypothetical protein N7456_009966 [Penicillium angulare]